jgi:hypothetical protein
VVTGVPEKNPTAWGIFMGPVKKPRHKEPFAVSANTFLVRSLFQFCRNGIKKED